MALTLALSACSPKYDWRDYRSNDAPYAVLFPGKPATHTRSIRLDQPGRPDPALAIDMTMTAAEVDGVVFAVGSARLADPTQAPAALAAMRTALMRNIDATDAADAGEHHRIWRIGAAVVAPVVLRTARRQGGREQQRRRAQLHDALAFFLRASSSRFQTSMCSSWRSTREYGSMVTSARDGKETLSGLRFGNRNEKGNDVER